MQTQYLIEPEVPQVPPYDEEQMAQGLAKDLAMFLFPLLVQLDRLLDKRLVRTFLQTIQVMIAYRDRVGGLLLSELGGYLLSPDKAPAGTKRLSNLLHSPKWTAKVVEDDLWQRADHQVQTWQEQGEDALAIWDSSEWEKPESEASEDLCAVRSSKAKRLTHIKPGYYNPPGRPIFVPGLHWLAVIVVGRSAQLGPPLLAAMRWWSSRGAQASFKRDEEGKLLVERLLLWGRAVVHIFDQGEAFAFWLGLLVAFGLRFVLRWRGDYQLCDAQGNRRKAWRIALGKRGWSERTIWDSRRAQWVHASVLALPVTHPEYRDTPLWLVVCRSKGRTPWYLLTAEPITTDEDAWRVVFAYMRRWQIELAWRFDKSELAEHSSASVVLAGAHEAVGHGDRGLRLSLASAGSALWAIAALAPALLLSSHRLALALGQGPTLPPACCPQPLVATLSTLLCCLGQAAPWGWAWSSHLRLFALG